MKTSQKGIELIKLFEGFRSVAYKCPAGVWTIGYGSTSGVKEGMKVSTQQAENLLREHLSNDEKRLSESGLKLNQNQFDALVSFVYNVGYESFRKSTLAKVVWANASDMAGVKSELAKWTRAAGRELPGLVARREKEYELYSSK